MKRSYSDMSLSLLPLMTPDDPKHFKSILEGTYTLRVIKCTDISKPAERPIDEIEEPEEDEVVQQSKLNKSNARMIQLQLRDSNGTEIMAIETERIEKLNEVKPNYIITIDGPIEVRCKNIMLQNRHITNVRLAGKEEVAPEPSVTQSVVAETIRQSAEPTAATASATREAANPQATSSNHPPPAPVYSLVQPTAFATRKPVAQIKPEIVLLDEEDWNEEEENDCIVLN